MTKSRLEAFSDGVIAIIITIMVLELKIPHDTGWHSLRPLLIDLSSYALSFTLVAIYWGNHHHLLHTVAHVNSRILWANIHLLFWLSLIPFATRWVNETEFSNFTVATYGGLQTICGIAYYILIRTISGSPGQSGHLAESLAKQSRKGVISQIIYISSVPLAFVHPVISSMLFIIVALIWLIPDRNIEQALKQ